MYPDYIFFDNKLNTKLQYFIGRHLYLKHNENST